MKASGRQVESHHTILSRRGTPATLPRRRRQAQRLSDYQRRRELSRIYVRKATKKRQAPLAGANGVPPLVQLFPNPS